MAILGFNDNQLNLPLDAYVGNLAGLIPILPVHPGLVANPKSTIARLIARKGVNVQLTDLVRDRYGDPSLTAYNAFNSFHGTFIADNQLITEYLVPALEGHGEDKKGILFVGPPGGGKSDKVEALKALWRTGEPMPTLAGCPIKESPLNLFTALPRVALNRVGGRASRAHSAATSMIAALRLAEQLNWNARACKQARLNGLDTTNEALATLALQDVRTFVDVVVYGLNLPKATRNTVGNPCPICMEAVLGRFSNNPVDIADFDIGAMYPAHGDGTVDVPEVDALNFSTAEWIGRRNIRNIGTVDPADPRSVEYDGYYCRANRGMIILAEILKNPPRSHRSNIELLQSRRIPIAAPHAAYTESGLHIVAMLLGHTNEAEYNQFKADATNEAYFDRYHVIYHPYPREANEAKKITEKMWSLSDFSNPVEEGGVHLEPLLTELEARFRVLTALEEDPERVPLMLKLGAYNGDLVRGSGMGTIVNAGELRQRASIREGMEGVSPRQTAETVLGGLAARAKMLAGQGAIESPCVTSREFVSAMFAWIKSNVADANKGKAYAGFLSDDLAKWRRKELSTIVRASFLESFEKECWDTFDKYVEWSNAAVLNKNPRSAGSSETRVTTRERDDFLRDIEAGLGLGVTDAQKLTFRREVQAAVNEWQREHPGQKLRYDVHLGLKDCIEKLVLSKVSGLVKILTENAAHTTEERKRLEGARQRLITEHGFCSYCANELFAEVGSTQNFLVD